MRYNITAANPKGDLRDGVGKLTIEATNIADVRLLTTLVSVLTGDNEDDPLYNKIIDRLIELKPDKIHGIEKAINRKNQQRDARSNKRF